MHSRIPTTPRRSIVFLVLSGGILASSTAAIFIRFAQADGADSLLIAAARLTIASLVLAPIVLFRHRATLIKLTRQECIAAILAGVFLAAHFAAWISSLQFTSVASSVVLVSTTPVWVALLSPRLLGEGITRQFLMGMSLSLIGGIVIGVSGACSMDAGHLVCPSFAALMAGKALWGNLLALAGAWMAAGYMLVGRKVHASIPLMPYIFVVYGAAAIVLLLAVLVTGLRFTSLAPVTYVWFLLLALVPQLLGHTSINWALRHVNASLVALVLLGEPVGSSILAMLFLQELPGWMEIAGAVLILVGIYLSSRGRVV